MNKVIALIAIVCSMAWLNHSLSSELYAVQSGELTLVCVINDEARTIAPSQVTGLMDDTWIFSNGHAKNCIVKPAD